MTMFMGTLKAQCTISTYAGSSNCVGILLFQLQRALFIMMGSQSAANRSFIILLSERLIVHTFFFFPSSSQTY